MASVLIVDDDADIRATLRLLLEEESHTVVDVPSGGAALAALRAAGAPMVVLLDLLMPGMDGIEVLRRVRQEPELAARHAFAIMTANHRPLLDAAHDLLAALRVAVVRKPFDVETVLNLVTRLSQRLPTDGQP